MEIELEKVFERDIDLLMINKFINDKNLVDLFCSKVNLSNYSVTNAQHSIMDENGESDITIILTNNNGKVAFLIEDKIDAIAMPEQRSRYDLRGEKGIKQNIYDNFYVFIIAPKDYLESNSEAQKYENKISYEELIDVFKNDIYAKSLLEQAIEEKKKGYSVVEDKKVTLFWENYYNFVEEKYPNLNIKRYEGPRGANAWWPGFILPIKGIKIDHKSNRGDVDLCFDGMGDYYSEISKILAGKLDDDMNIVRTGKSMSIRIKVPVVNFNENFNDYIYQVNESLKAVERFYKFIEEIDYRSILKLKDK